MAKYKTPGVYVQEIDAFPNSVVGVSTSVPVFVGHTERHGQPGAPAFGRVTSMAHFEALFGGRAPFKFDWDNANEKVVLADNKRFWLFDAVRLFFENGGSAAWIASAGGFDAAPTLTSLRAIFDDNTDLARQQEPSIVVIPDAMALNSAASAAGLYGQAMQYCQKAQSMITIADVYRPDSAAPDENAFRNNVGGAALDYGAAYYPWAHTTLYGKNDLGLENCSDDVWDALKTLLTNAKGFGTIVEEIDKARTPVAGETDADVAARAKQIERLHPQALNQPDYADLFEQMRRLMNTQPVAGAVAGLYARSDRTRGYWCAPAGVTASLNGLVAPTVQITNDEQEDLNAPISGLAINAIRTFPGIGSRVFGARTLDANSLDYRYVNVRRTMIFIEMSIKLALKAYVFEPNTASTQASAKSMVENFLTNQWTAGALTGTTAAEAFVVRVGAAAGQTDNDTASGLMKMVVGLRPARPAEFIELTFTQQVQV